MKMEQNKCYRTNWKLETVIDYFGNPKNLASSFYLKVAELFITVLKNTIKDIEHDHLYI